MEVVMIDETCESCFYKKKKVVHKFHYYYITRAFFLERYNICSDVYLKGLVVLILI